MRSTLKFLLALVVALLLMLAFRSLVFTIYTVEGSALEREFLAGDRVMVNRWSYGLRTGGEGLFSYGRLMRRPIARGDLVAFEDPTDVNRNRVLICECAAVPGDTILVDGRVTEVPGLQNCSDTDYYWMRSLNDDNPLDSRYFGFVPELCIIGRAFLIVYSIDPQQPLLKGWRQDRLLLLR